MRAPSLLLLSLAATGTAFVLPGATLSSPRRCSRPQQQQKTKTTALPAVPVLAVAAEAATKLLIAAPTLYALMSVNEYVTHRYYQHAEFNKSPWLQRIAKWACGALGKPVPVVRGGGHVEHHAETLDDMTLKTDDKWRSTVVAKSLDADKYRGTAFSWTVSALMLLQMLPTTIPVFYVLGFSLPATLAVLLPAMLVHALVWNALHPHMHALPDVPLLDGAPSGALAALRSTPYFRFLYTNHQGHHVVGGRGNYNVACPGADHLFRTFVPEADWRPKVTTDYASHHGEFLDLDQQIENHIARSSFYENATALA